MSPRVLLLLVLLVELAACPKHGEPVKPIDNQTQHGESGDEPVVVPLSPSEWSVTTTRRQGPQTATATVIVRTAPTPQLPAPHAGAAAAQAWLLLAHQTFDASAFADAVAAAKQGISELGPDYRPKLAKDDTTIRMAMADESIANGDLQAGATSLIAVLDSRLYMYFVRYADTARRSDH